MSGMVWLFFSPVTWSLQTPPLRFGCFPQIDHSEYLEKYQVNRVCVCLLAALWGYVGSQFPNQELNPGPLQWKCRVLTTAFSKGPELCFCGSQDQQREDQPVFLTILLHTCLSHAVLAATSRLALNIHILGVWRCTVTIFVADLAHQVLVLFLQFCSLFMRRFGGRQ